MDDQVLTQIVQALDTILDPNTSASDRTTAHSICESCKENELSCLIGYTLASKHDAAQHVKHFGLQLMHQFVRNRWTKASQETQIQAKNNAVELIKNCQKSESSYVKDGVAHVLAEVIKHVWPQQWPSMVDDLLAIANLGAVQTELVELVFLRIAEDVAVLQNISVSHRSQDIRHGLSLSIGQLMKFFMTILETNSVKYASLLGTTNQVELGELETYHTLSCTTLRTLQGFFEWIATEHVFANDGIYVMLLCKLLEVEGLKAMSAECLTLAVHRKGQAADRKRILVLLSPAFVEAMVAAIKKAVASPVTDEDQYLFLKRMGGLISSLAGQLVSAWAYEEEASEGTISSLAPLTAFLNLMLDFLRQDNPVLAGMVTVSWQQLLQHRGMCKDETLRSYVRNLLEITGSAIQRCIDSHLPVYAQLDFNDPGEVHLFLSMHRRNLLLVVRGCAGALPSQCMQVVMEWLATELHSAVDTGKDENGVKREHCSNTSPTYARWDALKSVLEMTIRSAVYNAKKQEVLDSMPIQAAEQLLHQLLSYETADVLLCQCLLSFIGAFLPMMEVFEHKKDVMVGIIQRFSKLLKYSIIHPNRFETTVVLFRRHCLSSILHLCKYYPSYVMLAYEQFKETMSEVIGPLNNLEKISICEALVLVSGEWNNFAQQSALIGEVMSLAKDRYLTKDDPRIGTPKGFAHAIGLCSPAAQYSDDLAATFRNDISFCVAMTMAMINRSRIPEDHEALQNGGFLDEDGNVRHPCTEHVLEVMEYVATLVENFHALWSAHVAQIIHTDFRKSLEIRDSERTSMVSFNPTVKVPEERVEKAPWERMQTFILIVLENCYQILGGVGKCCNMQLYASPSISVLLKKVFSDIQTLPELRIRSFTRQFVYYFLKSCPAPCYHSVVAPVLHKYCLFMNDVLQKQWAEYATKEEARLKVFESYQDKMQEYDDTREEDEILKEQQLRVVSREYLEMLVNLCVNKRPQPKNVSKEEDHNIIGNDSDMQDDSMSPPSVPNSSQLTPLGLCLVQADVAEVLLATALTSLSWHDTTTAFKSVQLTWPLLKHTFASAPCLPGDAAKFIFECVLLGLQRQGQHEGCSAQLIALSLFIYVSLRPTHDSLFSILQAIPKIDRNALDAFDKSYTKYAEKKRKATFRKLVSKIIEQHIGQRYQCRQDMRRLPRFFQGKKPKSLDFDAESLGLEMFFKPESG